jgi:hypothetical protein
MDLIDTPKAVSWLTFKFASSSLVLMNVTTFGVAVGAIVLAVEVKD